MRPRNVGDHGVREEMRPRPRASRSPTPLIGAVPSCGHAASPDPYGRRTGAACVVAAHLSCAGGPAPACPGTRWVTDGAGRYVAVPPSAVSSSPVLQEFWLERP